MDVEHVQSLLREKVTAEVRLFQEGIGRFRVLTPFCFDDGDSLAIVLLKRGEMWRLSDEGHTMMHLTYWLDEGNLRRGTRSTLIENALSAFSVSQSDGVLFIDADESQLGDALFSFVQALLKITDVTYLSQERVRSTFLDDFRSFLSARVLEGRRTFDWHDPKRDPERKYVVDCRINGMAKPIFVFALSNDDKVRDATIGILQFEKWGLPFHSLAIYENQEDVNRKVVARFSDVCEKQFSSLSAGERIERYLAESMDVA